ncbi:hypothetical protein C8R47DRAFT_473641 [Mycena vitilis]|nr:hypothetical protein C8R47DRAFT_473641 [Mycena vitilis]
MPQGREKNRRRRDRCCSDGVHSFVGGLCHEGLDRVLRWVMDLLCPLVPTAIDADGSFRSPKRPKQAKARASYPVELRVLRRIYKLQCDKTAPKATHQPVYLPQPLLPTPGPLFFGLDTVGYLGELKHRHPRTSVDGDRAFSDATSQTTGLSEAFSLKRKNCPERPASPAPPTTDQTAVPRSPLTPRKIQDCTSASPNHRISIPNTSSQTPSPSHRQQLSPLDIFPLPEHLKLHNIVLSPSLSTNISSSFSTSDLPAVV